MKRATQHCFVATLSIILGNLRAEFSTRTLHISTLYRVERGFENGSLSCHDGQFFRKTPFAKSRLVRAQGLGIHAQAQPQFVELLSKLVAGRMNVFRFGDEFHAVHSRDILILENLLESG